MTAFMTLAAENGDTVPNWPTALVYVASIIVGAAVLITIFRS